VRERIFLASTRKFLLLAWLSELCFFIFCTFGNFHPVIKITFFFFYLSQERRRVPETVTAEIDPEKLKAAAIKSLNGKHQAGI
jgi:hypothetical protein